MALLRFMRIAERNQLNNVLFLLQTNIVKHLNAFSMRVKQGLTTFKTKTLIVYLMVFSLTATASMLARCTTVTEAPSGGG